MLLLLLQLLLELLLLPLLLLLLLQLLMLLLLRLYDGLGWLPEHLGRLAVLFQVESFNYREGAIVELGDARRLLRQVT